MDVTRLLQAVERGEEAAAEELVTALYRELHGMADRAMAREPDSHTLQPTALVNEAWLRLFPAGKAPSWEGRRHFFGAVARAMRCVLVDHARARRTRKRGGGGRPEPLDLWIDVLETAVPDVVALHETLEQLEELDPQLARLVELRFFAGLSVPECARVLKLSESSVARSWRTARAWLRGRLS